MEVRIIRGQNQIGGSIIEVRSLSTKIILDIGRELNETIPVVPNVQGLFQGNPEYQAVLLSHYHEDHIGLLPYVLKGIPIFMGIKAYSVYQAVSSWLDRPPVTISGYLESGKQFVVGDITILPFLCDHSAFDSYMILLASEGKHLLYTGDFRSTGRKSFRALLQNLCRVDLLITEGTTLSRPVSTVNTERELEEQAYALLKDNEAPAFVLMAATNIDRLVTMYKAAFRANRLFLEDLYTATVSCAAGHNIPNPLDFSNVRVFLTIPSEKNHQLLCRFGDKKIGRNGIAGKQFLMCVRPSMRLYLDKLSHLVPFSGGIMFYSLWEGYREKQDMADFLQFMEEKDIKAVPLHTSGHAVEGAFNALVDQTKPKYILPVHTENATWFNKYSACQIVYNSDFVF